jgi:hypothetical protein
MMVNDGTEMGSIRVSRFTYTSETATNAALLATEVQLLQWKQVTYMHKGGWLGFEPSADPAAAAHVSIMIAYVPLEV